MAAEKDYTRLGLFLFLATVVVLATVLFFVQQRRDREVMKVVTYTDQNVTGLTAQSPVRFRGVTIGQVEAVRIDSRTRMIEIDFELFVDTLTDLGGDIERVRQGMEDLTEDKDVRAQVVGNPVTGEAHLLIDIPAAPPPPLELGLEPDRPYVPSMPSALGRVADQLPELIDRGEALLARTEQIMARLPDTLDRTDRFFDTADGVFRDSEIPQLSREAREWLQTTSDQVEELDERLDGLLGEGGRFMDLLESVDAAEIPATTEAVRDTLDQASLAAEELRRSLPAIRSSLEELRALSRLLEDQPEDLVYGRRPQEESR
jgi:phospholipid/cholesterol/gamma-HCH transport system substrate-binding protein/paraquat-inducible protein B